MAKWEDDLPGKRVSLAYLPSPGQVKVRIGVKGLAEDRQSLQTLLKKKADAFVALANDHVIGRGDSRLPEAVLNRLKQRGETVGTAESCTGGKVASMLTSVPGASAAFWGGIVAYDNAVKMRQLGVSEKDLQHHGAVSEAVVKSMAAGARKALGTDWAVATSGVAGPSGGTPEKPVGMVWMAVAGPMAFRHGAIGLAISANASFSGRPSHFDTPPRIVERRRGKRVG